LRVEDFDGIVTGGSQEDAVALDIRCHMFDDAFNILDRDVPELLEDFRAMFLR